MWCGGASRAAGAPLRKSPWPRSSAGLHEDAIPTNIMHAPSRCFLLTTRHFCLRAQAEMLQGACFERLGSASLTGATTSRGARADVRTLLRSGPSQREASQPGAPAQRNARTVTRGQCICACGCLLPKRSGEVVRFLCVAKKNPRRTLRGRSIGVAGSAS